MTTPLVLFCLFGLPALALWVAVLRLRSKTRALADWRERTLAALGAEPLDDGCFRWHGRVYSLDTNPNPLFSGLISVRISTFCPGLLDAEIRAARNVPTKTPQKLADDDFYAPFVLDSPSPDEAVDWMLAVKPTLQRLFPGRWGAVTHLYGEIALSQNAETPADLAPDLEALAALAAVRAERKPRGGIWTMREGFEPHPAAWHWKPEQRAALPEGAKRWCVSAWYDNSYLNAPLARFLWTLAGDRPACVVTAVERLDFLGHAFGEPVAVADRVARVPRPEMAVAADQFLDGEFFGHFVAGDPGASFAGALKVRFHDLAIAQLPAARFIARRLFDDEFSWFSGEVEIVSTALTDDEVRGAFAKLADDYGARVVELERPFSFKLLKEDRLEVTA